MDTTFTPNGRRRFSPGTKRPKDVSFCPVARSMIDAHYRGSPEPQDPPEIQAKFGGHMMGCHECRCYEHDARLESEERKQDENS